MNEHIVELAKQAGLSAQSETTIHPNQVKFAELIVKECADIATINSHQWESPGYYVLKHFGIEQ
jgi:hypothetical protein